MPSLQTIHQESNMKAISDIMTREVKVISPDGNVQQAAQMMRDQDIGSVPVCNGKKLVGMITDRDIVIRTLADGKSPANTKVSEVMTDDVFWCFEDQTAGEVLQQMGDQQIRRIPVINRDKELCGIVSLGDLATRVSADTDDALEEISASVPPNQSSTGKQPTARH
jgi:CBS domain-containing protein